MERFHARVGFGTVNRVQAVAPVCLPDGRLTAEPGPNRRENDPIRPSNGRLGGLFGLGNGRFLRVSGVAQQNCKKAVDRIKTPPYMALTDAALPDFPGSVRIGRQH